MAITDPEWNQATDPYLLASAHSWSAVANFPGGGAGPSAARALVFDDPIGFFNLLINDPDVQEIFFERDIDPTYLFPPDTAYLYNFTGGTWTYGTYGDSTGMKFQDAIPRWKEPGSAWREMFAIDLFFCVFLTFLVLTGTAGADTTPGNQARFGIILPTTLPAGENILNVYTALAWDDKDPAQLMMSWLMHYLKGVGIDPNVARVLMDKDRFQAASAYYDGKRHRLDSYRVVGETLAASVKRLLEQTTLVMGIQMNGTLMVGHPEALEVADTILDPTNPELAISSISGGYTDEWLLERVEMEYGNLVGATVELEFQASDRVTRFPLRDGPLGNVWSGETGRGGKTIRVNARETMLRSDYLRHFDLGHYSSPVRKLIVEQGPMHLAYDIGMKVPCSVPEMALDTSVPMVCYERRMDGLSLNAQSFYGELGNRVGKRPYDFTSVDLMGYYRPAYNATHDDLEILNHAYSDSGPYDDGQPQFGGIIDKQLHLLPFTGGPSAGGFSSYSMRSARFRRNHVNGWPVWDNAWQDTVQTGTAQYEHGFRIRYEVPWGSVGPLRDGLTFCWIIKIHSPIAGATDNDQQMAVWGAGPKNRIWSVDSAGQCAVFTGGSTASFGITLTRDTWLAYTVVLDTGSFQARMFWNQLRVGNVINTTPNIAYDGSGSLLSDVVQYLGGIKGELLECWIGDGVISDAELLDYLRWIEAVYKVDVTF